MLAGKQVKLIWAEGLNRAIGVKNTLPWHVPEDLAHFKEMTKGAPVIMGWNTWDSLPEKVRPLPGRDNFVLTRDEMKTAEGATTLNSLESALRAASGDVVWVIGGANIYAQALEYADEIHVTVVDVHVQNGDAFAPDLFQFHRTEEGEWNVSSSGDCYRFDVYKPA